MYGKPGQLFPPRDLLPPNASIISLARPARVSVVSLSCSCVTPRWEGQNKQLHTSLPHSHICIQWRLTQKHETACGKFLARTCSWHWKVQGYLVKQTCGLGFCTHCVSLLILVFSQIIQLQSAQELNGTEIKKCSLHHHIMQYFAYYFYLFIPSVDREVKWVNSRKRIRYYVLVEIH